MTRALRFALVIIIILFVSILQSPVLALETNDPSAQANIHATQVASNFASKISPGRYYIMHNTKRGDYLIGSTDQKPELTAPNVTMSITTNTTGKILPTPNETISTKISKIDTAQQVDNRSIPSVNNTYNIFIFNIGNKNDTLQPAANRTKAAPKKVVDTEYDNKIIMQQDNHDSSTQQDTDKSDAADIHSINEGSKYSDLKESMHQYY